MKNRLLRIQWVRVVSTKGFTLVELLIVIGIIAILTGFLTANYIGVQQRSDDGKRKADIRQIQSALELYRSDVGAYPNTLAPCGQSLSGNDGTTYLDKIPCDPSDNATSYFYCNTDPSTYMMVACLQNANDSDSTATPPSSSCGTISCPPGIPYSNFFVIHNP